ADTLPGRFRGSRPCKTSTSHTRTVGHRWETVECSRHPNSWSTLLHMETACCPTLLQALLVRSGTAPMLLTGQRGWACISLQIPYDAYPIGHRAGADRRILSCAIVTQAPPVVAGGREEVVG